MKALGIFEIFYGQPWPEEERLKYARLLKDLGFGFYMYGPKADACLRRNWRARPTGDELAKYRRIRDEYRRQGIHFGIILSPHELDAGFDKAARHALSEKIKVLSDLGLDYFGLFFDDMKSSADLAQRQLEVAAEAAKSTQAKLVFCPSFYCFDPMLDMLFGDRPEGYLEALGNGLDAKTEILWTGEQIISPEFSGAQLARVTALLGRKPFICDNFYADDGPLFCNFLGTQAPTGRPRDVFSLASHWGFNLMNQAGLSRLVLHSINGFVSGGLDPQAAFTAAVRAGVSGELADFILANAQKFSSEGLEALAAGERAKMREVLTRMPPDDCAREIAKWLDGEYAVDFTLMLEQSCFMG